jgi:hypothetical protein
MSSFGEENFQRSTRLGAKQGSIEQSKLFDDGSAGLDRLFPLGDLAPQKVGEI